MINEINLLHGSTSRKNKLLSKLAAIRMVSMSFLFVISFSSIVLFILIALSPLPSLQQREIEEARTLATFDKKIVKILLTKERLTNAGKILQTRNVRAETLQKLAAQVPGDLTVNSIKLLGKKIEMSVTSKSLANLDTFTANVTEFNKREKRFKKIMLASLILDADSGKYVLSIELENV